MASGNRSIQFKIVLTCLFFGVFIGLIDSFIDAFYFDEGSLFQQIFRPSAFEIYIRSLILFIFLTFSFVAIHVFSRLSQSESEREKTLSELKQTQEELKVLRGIIPICAACKKIRDDQGYWQQIESYIHQHSEAAFSHGICPECMKKLYPDLVDEAKKP